MSADKHMMPMADFREKFGPAMDRFLTAIPVENSPLSLRLEIDRLKEALGVAACSLDSMSGLTSRNECHRTAARDAIRSAMGA